MKIFEQTSAHFSDPTPLHRKLALPVDAESNRLSSQLAHYCARTLPDSHKTWGWLTRLTRISTLCHTSRMGSWNRQNGNRALFIAWYGMALHCIAMLCRAVLVLPLCQWHSTAYVRSSCILLNPSFFALLWFSTQNFSPHHMVGLCLPPSDCGLVVCQSSGLPAFSWVKRSKESPRINTGPR